MENEKKSFFKFVTSNDNKLFLIGFTITFFAIGKAYLYSFLIGIPCDGAFLCGLFSHLSEIPWPAIIMYEVVSVLPLVLALLSFWGIYKKNFILK